MAHFHRVVEQVHLAAPIRRARVGQASVEVLALLAGVVGQALAGEPHPGPRDGMEAGATVLAGGGELATVAAVGQGTVATQAGVVTGLVAAQAAI